MYITLANKIDSYYDKETHKSITTQKQKIIRAYELLGIASDRQIAEVTGIDRHLIPDRRLRLKNRVEYAYTKKDPVTGRKVAYYKLRSN